MLELLGGPLVLAGCFELGGQGVAQVDEQLDVEGGIGEPGGGQRPGGPVRCRVVLGQAQAQGLLDDGAEPDVLSAQEAGCQLGVEQGGGLQAARGQARDVLVGCVEDPLGSVEGRGQLGQRAAGHRVDEKGADAVSSELDEVGVLSVAEAGGPFGVNGDGALAIRQKLSGSAQLGGGGGDLGEPVLGAGVVDDVVRAVFLAMERGRIGGRYFLTDGRSYSSQMFSDLLKKHLGVGLLLRIKAPLAVLRAVTFIGERYSRITRKITALNDDKYNIMRQRNWLCDINPAREELGYKPTVELEEGVRRSVEWYKKNKWI